MDYYENENLRHLSYLECLFMLPRRGWYQLPKFLQYLKSAVQLNINDMMKAFRIQTQYTDMQNASQSVLDGQAVFFMFGVITSLLSIVFTALTIMTSGFLFVGIGAIFSSILGILMSWVIYALVAWILSMFYDRWLTIVMKILLGLELVGAVIAMITLLGEIGSAITVITLLKMNIFWIIGLLIGIFSSVISILASFYYIKCLSKAEELFF